MARDCYQVFKDTYNQAIADGLPVAVATAAAQAAQTDCLTQQARQVPAAQPIIVTPGSRPQDPGPTNAATDTDRAKNLGIRKK